MQLERTKKSRTSDFIRNKYFVSHNNEPKINVNKT